VAGIRAGPTPPSPLKSVNLQDGAAPDMTRGQSAAPRLQQILEKTPWHQQSARVALESFHIDRLERPAFVPNNRLSKTLRASLACQTTSRDPLSTHFFATRRCRVANRAGPKQKNQPISGDCRHLLTGFQPILISFSRFCVLPKIQTDFLSVVRAFRLQQHTSARQRLPWTDATPKCPATEEIGIRRPAQHQPFHEPNTSLCTMKALRVKHQSFR